MSHYDSYATFKNYSTPQLGAKHIRRFDREVWEPANFRIDHAVLEIGCGTGLFLSYLAAKGVERYIGIDQDPALANVLSEGVREHFRQDDALTYAEAALKRGDRFDRIALFDVLEHFDVDGGRALLHALASLLATDGKIVVKVPNAASPWGLQFQYGDLTHRTAYTPESMAQQAIAAGLNCEMTYAHKLGSPARQRWETIIHGLLDRVVATPPSIWEGNFFAILTPVTQSP